MKKYFYLILLAAVVTGCDPVGPQVKDKFNNDTYTIVVVDGCQYLTRHKHTPHAIFTHKGNCTNSIHYK